MNRQRPNALRSAGVLVAALVWSGLVILCPAAARAAENPALPPVAAHQVDFHREILPILANRCITCHARGQAKGGFSLETRTQHACRKRLGPGSVAGQ